MKSGARIRSNWTLAALVTAAVAGGGFLLLATRWSRQYFRRRRLKHFRSHVLRSLACGVSPNDPHLRVQIVKSEDDWIQVKETFMRCIEVHPILGFDCEWVTPRKMSPRPISLLQLAVANSDICYLIRLNYLGKVPEDLRKILSDAKVLKFGVGIQDDSVKLLNDFGVSVGGFVDLRHLLFKVRSQGAIRKTGLAGLAKEFLNVVMDKDWRIRAGDWEAEELSPRQVAYAANDALFGLNVAMAIALEVNANRLVDLPDQLRRDELAQSLFRISQQFAGVPIKVKSKPPKEKAIKEASPAPMATHKMKAFEERLAEKRAKGRVGLRQSQMYYNVKLEAPDGQPLCTMNEKKALWYVERGLGVIVNEDPLTIRLNFEPAGRPEGEEGQYYLQVKSDMCVVCGAEESFMRKYIVPYEYRRYFPDVFRDHSSHDILLMCHSCHSYCNLVDSNLRRELAEECDAPIGTKDDIKFHEDRDLYRIKSAAKALLKDGHKIPEQRREDLAKIVRGHFDLPDGAELDEERLKEAVDLNPIRLNAQYRPHGQAVVEHYIESGQGILALSRRWREHFLREMRPRHLPALWSVDHQKSYQREAEAKLCGSTRTDNGET